MGRNREGLVLPLEEQGMRLDNDFAVRLRRWKYRLVARGKEVVVLQPCECGLHDNQEAPFQLRQGLLEVALGLVSWQKGMVLLEHGAWL